VVVEMVVVGDSDGDALRSVHTPIVHGVHTKI
jgi:hypothetical protein